MRKGKWGLVALLAGLLLAFAAGCGGGDDDSAGVTKAEFSKQAEAICQQAEEDKTRNVEQALAKSSKGGEPVNIQVQARIVSEVALPPVERMTQELAELDVPEGDEETIEEMIAAFEAELTKVESEAKAVAEGDAGFFERANSIAKTYGLQACSDI